MAAMTWLERLRSAGRRRSIERAGIVCAVLTGHILVFMLMASQFKPAASAPVGVEGQVVMASLISAMPVTKPSPPARKARPKPAVTAKPVEVTHVAPAPDGLKPPEPETVADAKSSPDDPGQDTQLQLSDSDALALEQFQPVAAAGEPNTPCNLTAMLASAFTQSPAVRQGLEELPASDRSVANAVNLWDGQWPEDSVAGGKALLRSLLVKAITSARPDCLTQPNRGPVLFLVPESQTMAVLAVGSGDWTWGDLLDAPSVQSNNYFLTLASETTIAP